MAFALQYLGWGPIGNTKQTDTLKQADIPKKANIPILKPKCGPFGRVNNVEKYISSLKSAPETASSIFCSNTGPFKELGSKCIKAIVETTATETVILELNKQLFVQNRSHYREVLSWMEKAQSQRELYPLPGPHRFINFSFMFDEEGKSLLSHAISLCIKDRGKTFLFATLKNDLAIDFLEPLGVVQGNKKISISPLAYAWQQNKWEDAQNCEYVADSLLQVDADIAQVFGKEKYTLAHFIHEIGIKDMPRFLNWFVRNGGHIDVKNAQGDTLLQAELKKNRRQSKSFSLAAHLLDLGANPDLKDCQGKNAIHLLCQNGSGSEAEVDLLKRMLNIAPHSFYAKDNAGYSPLYYAVLKEPFIEALYNFWTFDQQSTAKAALDESTHEQRCLQSSVSITQYAPVHIIERPFEETEILLQYSKEISNCREIDPQEIEKQTNTLEVPCLLKLLPIFTFNPEGYRRLLTAKQGSEGTMLHVLAKSSYRLVERLLELKIIEQADLNAVNSAGQTVFDIISMSKKSLSLFFYCENLDTEKALKLLEDGSQLDFEIFKDCSCLQKILYACFNFEAIEGQKVWDLGLELFKALLVKGVNPNIKNICQETALHNAVRAKHAKVINYIILLLDFGANPTLTNAEGKKPIDLLKDYPKPNYILIKNLLASFENQDDF